MSTRSRLEEFRERLRADPDRANVQEPPAP
ncbi:hypothetical protein MHY1_02371 [Methylovirgula sp. HY1]|nr:hypothetical protein MHY1_02371 [Methylovirgula sp. HY1]